jgi:formyltetrahydrofolate hydrolase
MLTCRNHTGTLAGVIVRDRFVVGAQLLARALNWVGKRRQFLNRAKTAVLQ